MKKARKRGSSVRGWGGEGRGGMDGLVAAEDDGDVAQARHRRQRVHRLQSGDGV